MVSATKIWKISFSKIVKSGDCITRVSAASQLHISFYTDSRFDNLQGEVEARTSPASAVRLPGRVDEELILHEEA